MFKHFVQIAVLFVSLSCTPLAHSQPLKVFILAGQSNMQGHAHVRTVEHLELDPDTKPMLDEMKNPDGSFKVCERVWISSIGCAETEQTGKLTAGFGASQNGPKIGPEFTFGLTLEKHTAGPILIIKTAWGGKSLNTDFRPPSAGPYLFNESQLANFQKQRKDLSAIQQEKKDATGVNYRLMIEHVRYVTSNIQRVVPNYNESLGYELAGFVWFQGWNDMVDSSTYPNRDKPGGYDAYTEVMTHFIRDVRQDLHAPKLPFVIGVLGVGGPVESFVPEEQRYRTIHQNFRMAMEAPAKLPEFQESVTALWTEKYWDRELGQARSKEESVLQLSKRQSKEKQLSPDEERSLQARLLQEQLTPRERLIIEKGISNFPFHYLGSAKILGGIGKGMAEAMLELISP